MYLRALIFPEFYNYFNRISQWCSSGVGNNQKWVKNKNRYRPVCTYSVGEKQQCITIKYGYADYNNKMICA